ncbi:MAG: DUF1850 domain-containing protein [Atribacterota bacterium]
MQKKKKIFFITSGLILIVIVIIVILFFISVYTLELKTFEENKLIFKQKVQPVDEFILKYTHSVALTPVWEIFIIDKDYQIVLIETDFLDHGAGLPYTTFENEIFVEEEGRFKIKNMHRIIPTPIYYRIGAVRENVFYFKGEEINLSSLVGDRLLTLEIYKNNLFNYLIGGSL